MPGLVLTLGLRWWVDRQHSSLLELMVGGEGLEWPGAVVMTPHPRAGGVEGLGGGWAGEGLTGI